MHSAPFYPQKAVVLRFVCTRQGLLLLDTLAAAFISTAFISTAFISCLHQLPSFTDKGS